MGEPRLGCKHWQAAMRSANTPCDPIDGKALTVASINMGTVWDRATEFLGDNIAVITPIALMAIFLPASITGNLKQVAAANPALGVWIGVANLVLALISLWGQLSITALALDLARSAGDAFRVGGGALLRSIVASCILLLIILITLLPVIAFVLYFAQGLMTGLGSSAEAMQEAMKAAISDLPGWGKTAIAFYAPIWLLFAYWLAARTILIAPIVVNEQRWASALTRSFGLTRGLTLKIAGLILLYALVAWVASLAAETVFGSVLRLVAGDDGGLNLAMIVTSVLVGAVATGFSVLAAAFVAKLYVAALNRSEDAPAI